MPRRPRPVLAAIALGLVAALGHAAPPPELPGVQIGEGVPEAALALELADLDDGRRRVGDLLGEAGSVFVFLSNTCPYAVDWFDRLPKMAELAEEQGIGFVAVNSNARKRKAEDSPQAMAELLEEQGFRFPYWVDADSALAEALGATRTPEVFLFDGGGSLVYRGAIDDHSGPFERVTEHWALDALREMAAGDGVSTALTTPLGCAVLKPRRRR
ncbi:MAG: redoxin family protein [Acidobacteriota bacterium]